MKPGLRGLPFTLRRWRVPLAVWALATAAGTIAGPFGTFAALGLAGRALYWGGVVAVAVALSLWFRALHRGPLAAYGRAGGLGLNLVYAAVLGAGIHGLNRMLFAGWGGPGDYLYLVGLILAIALGLEALGWLTGRNATPAPTAMSAGPPDGVAQFIARLPPDRRGRLIRIEAQDHYLLVVTDAGAATLLMRLADAEQELAGAGLRVHRSHWVAQGALDGLCRDGGRWRIVTSDGAEVPVARSARPAVAAARTRAAE